jgi:hypothetical protein
MDMDGLRSAILREHGVRLSPRDPILIVAAIHEKLLAEALAEVRRTVQASACEALAASVQQLETARQQAEALMNQAGKASAARMTAAETVAATMLADMLEQATRAERASRSAFRVAWATASIALLALAGTAGLWLMRLH